MNVNEIVQQLRDERSRLDIAIQALEGVSGASGEEMTGGGKRRGRPPRTINKPAAMTAKSLSAPKKRRRMSAAARKRIGESARARWATAKKSGRKRL